MLYLESIIAFRPFLSMTTSNTRIKNISAAAWAGLMIGDALGAPAEFCHHDDIMVKYPDGIQDMVPGFGIYTDRRPGEVTDDTQMAYCLHLALQDANGWSRDAALARYREWLATDPPDVDVVIYDALTGNPHPESKGNGALKRVMPIALWAASHPDFDWETAAREDAAITHPHPLCGDVNVLFVHTMLTAMQPGITAQEIFQSAKFFILKKKLSRALYCTILYRRFRPDYDGEHIGWLRVALHGVFHQMLYATSFREAMINVVSAGGDTDTNAAITGALLGAWKGIDCLDRSWLAAVRAANPRHYTKLLPSIHSLPRNPIRWEGPDPFYPRYHFPK